MAIIKTPAAGVSPYQESAAANPTVLRAGADGSTVLANTNVAATTANAAATNANGTVIVNGAEALNSLIATSRSGVFEGANVTINLEEQQFNTTNQVTSTTNYPSGGAGEIQFNSGSNSFASNAYFTYSDSNVITPGIRTDGYFYSNGAPFLAGGNAAIGNFVFTGDTMSISDDANVSLNIKGNSLGNNENYITINPTSIDIYAYNTNPYSYSELYLDNGNVDASYASIIVEANATPSRTWKFDHGGNLTLPGNTFAVNYANNQPVVIGGGNASFLSNGSAQFSLLSDYSLLSGNTTSPHNFKINDTYTPDIDLRNSSGTGMFTQGGSATIRTAGTYNWNFNANGTTQFPGNLLRPPAGNPLDIQVTSGNVYSTVSLYDTASQLIIQDNTTGANPAWALFEADLANVNTPEAVIILKPGDTGNEVRWTFDSDGNITFPGNVIQSPANIQLAVRSSTTSDDDNQVRLNQTSLDIYAYNSNTGSYSELYLDNSSASTPYAYISVEATSSPERRWVYSSDGNLRLPAGTPSINYANGSPYSQENKIFNGNTYANIEFPSGNLAVGVDVTAVTGAWINTYGNIVVNDQYNSEGESVLIDGGGNVYVTGASYNPAFSADQAFIRKLSPSGQVMWQYALPQSVNGSQFSSGETLAQDGSGNIYWLTNLWFDNGGNVQPMVAKLNSSDGYPSWTTQIGNVYYGEDITVNSSGQVFVVTNTGGRITSLNTNGTVAWSRDPSNGGTSIVDTGTYVIVGYSAGTVGAYNYSGNLLWTNQVFDTGPEVWGLAWDGTDWYAADSNGYIMKISGSDNSTILWQKHINRDGNGGNMFLTWIEYADGYIYATGTGNDGQVSDALITVKIDASNGNLVWARSLEANGIGQWYWYGHHDISVQGDFYAVTGQAYPAGSNNTKQVLAQLPVDGSLAGSTVGPYRYVDVPALTMDDTDVGGAGYNGSPSQPATVSVTHNYTFTGLVAPSPEVNILSPFVTGPVWTFNNNGDLQLPSGGKLGYAGMGWTGLTSANGAPVELTGSYASGNLSNQIFLNDGTLSILSAPDGGDLATWRFNADGNTVFPTLTTQRGDTTSGTITGQTLLFGDYTQEAVISTPNGINFGYPSSQRLVINPGAGAANTSGEGGDIYLWAGRGGNASGSGGDIKIRGGQGGDGSAGGNGGDGGYIRIEAGDAATTGGAAGWIQMTAGVGGENQLGGYVRITGGTGSDGNYPGLAGGGDANITGGYGRVNAPGGNVNLVGGISANGLADYGRVNITSGASTWVFDNSGNLITPGSSGNITGVDYISANVYTSPSNVVITVSDGNTWNFNSTGNLVFPTGMHIDNEGANTRISQNSGFLKMTAGNTAALSLGWSETESPGTGNIALLIANGGGSGYPGNLVMRTGNQNVQTFEWIFGSDANLSTPGDVVVNGVIQTAVYVTGNIPTASSVGAGSRAFVTDADSVTFGNLYVGGAGNSMPVWTNGTSWYIG